MISRPTPTSSLSTVAVFWRSRAGCCETSRRRRTTSRRRSYNYYAALGSSKGVPHSGPGSAESPSTKLCNIFALGRSRRRASTTSLLTTTNSDLRVEPGLSSSSKWPQRRELEIIVREAINQLPAVHRLVLLLRDVEQLSTAETAALLDLTVGAVKTRLHRARAALKRLLAPVVSSLDAPAEPRMTRRIRGFFARTLPGGLRCKEFEELISSYLDGELDRRQQVAFDMHLRRCPDCSRYLKAYQHTIELGRAFCEPTEGPIPADVPPDLADAVLSALQITAAMRPSE